MSLLPAPPADKSLIVTDSSPLIALSVMGLFPVLKELFDPVIIPQSVYRECREDLSKPQASNIEAAIRKYAFQIQPATNLYDCRLLEQVLDRGEAEAIILAKKLNGLVLIDEKAARQIAKNEEIPCVGSLYILLQAKQNQRIDSVIPPLHELIKHGYFLAPDLIQMVLEKGGELNQQSIAVFELDLNYV